MKELLYSRRKELLVLLICTFMYVTSFFIVEKIHFGDYNFTETWIDQYIPFLDIFVIPYILWFVYIVTGFVFFLLKDKKGFYRTSFYIFLGMYICIFIYIFIPNAQGLRVELDMNQPLQKLMAIIYSVDTATNVCPSIHVYNSIMMYVSLLKNESFKKSKFFTISTGILTGLICLSTVFTKQHAFIDVIYSLPLCYIIYKLYDYLSNKDNFLYKNIHW